MGEFALDTSGIVFLTADDGVREGHTWASLSPFEQGYIEALFASLGNEQEPFCGFSDLAPETLKAIWADCVLFCKSVLGAPNPYTVSDRQAGGEFWAARQTGKLRASSRFHAFPPLVPFLNDDGKVCLREASNG